MNWTNWIHGKPMNDMPFMHNSFHGTSFTCDRCDFKTPVNVKLDVSLMEVADVDILSKIMLDISEMIGYHATNIFPQLNGFQGYDCIRYKIV